MKSRARILAALALAIIPSFAAQAQSTDILGKMMYPLQGCPKIANPDALRSLAQSCAQDLAYDSNCRAHTKDGEKEFVIVKDCSPKKPEGFLIIPVKPVTGIEDTQVFSDPLANLWEDAWLWSRKYPGEPAERTGLAVNSKNARSQNQLHIHISCVLPKVSDVLQAAKVPLCPAKPITLELGSDKNTYQVVKVTTLTGDNNPFKVIQAMPGVAGDMQDQSVAVIGSRNDDEYYVLDTTASGKHRAHAEELLEQTCAPIDRAQQERP